MSHKHITVCNIIKAAERDGWIVWVLACNCFFSKQRQKFCIFTGQRLQLPQQTLAKYKIPGTAVQHLWFYQKHRGFLRFKKWVKKKEGGGWLVLSAREIKPPAAKLYPASSLTVFRIVYNSSAFDIHFDNRLIQDKRRSQHQEQTSFVQCIRNLFVPLVKFPTFVSLQWSWRGWSTDSQSADGRRRTIASCCWSPWIDAADKHHEWRWGSPGRSRKTGHKEGKKEQTV